MDFEQTTTMPIPLQPVKDRTERKSFDSLVTTVLDEISADGEAAKEKAASGAKANAKRVKLATGSSKRAKRQGRKKSRKTKQTAGVGSQRGIESMLRNSYRAQLSMIALAARKANIMISVNGFLLSLLTLSSAYILTTEPLLLIPSTLFLCTCIMAIFFAVLAARPQKVDKSKTRPKDFRQDHADLLVFEHFAHLSKDDHMSVMLEMMQDQDRVYRCMVAHIHFLGKSAQKRFDLLQISYNSFLFGLILSSVALAVVALVFYI
jgi:hypothetical protein